MRVQKTKKVRFNVKIMAENHKQRVKRAVWDGILERRKHTRILVTTLCNFENMMLSKLKIEGMNTL